MPFKSEAQRRFLWENHPGVAKEFAANTPAGTKLPFHVGGAPREQAASELSKEMGGDPTKEPGIGNGGLSASLGGRGTPRVRMGGLSPHMGMGAPKMGGIGRLVGAIHF